MPTHRFAVGLSFVLALAGVFGANPAGVAAASPVVSDTFVRPAASGTWGSAAIGGAYSYVGSQVDFSLSGSSGQINLGSPGVTRAAYLPVGAQDVDLTYSVSFSKLPAGGGSVYAYGSLRRSSTADDRIKVRLAGSGAIYLSISQFSAGSEKTIGSELKVAGLTYVPGTDLKVHGQASGVSPTTLVARVWPAAGTEPATWQVSRSDSTAGLQGPGSVGVRAYMSSGTTNAPISVAFDGLLATPLGVDPPPVPVASFTYAASPGTLTVNFSDTSSNGPTSWAWDFGDGATATVANPSHTFGAPGTYTVTELSSNASGPSLAPASQQVTVSLVSPYASDAFARPAAAGTWGSAPVGGAYSYVGSQADFSLTGTAGRVTIGSPGATRAAYLPVSAQDVDLTFSASFSKLPAGGGSTYAYGSLRRSTTADYRVKARITGSGAVYLSFSQFSAGSEKTIGSELQVAGLTYVPGTDLKVHAQVSGTNPTVLVARIWPAAGPEPAAWLISRTDTTAGLQVPGSVGIRAYTSTGTTNTPISVSFDSIQAVPATASTVAPLPAFSNIWLIVLENEEESAIVGNSSAPYLNSLAASYGLATNYDALTHGSQPNYIAMVAGWQVGVTDNDPHDLAAPTLFDQIEASGRTWQMASENNPGNCFTGATASNGEDGTGAYVRRHNPAISFTSISANPTRCALIQDFSHFVPGAASFSLIEPNLCHTMHDCSIAAGDAWLATFVPTIMASSAYQAGGLILITFDEGTTNVGGGGQVATFVISPQAKHGFVSAIPHDHYSLLRTIQAAWNLPCLAVSCTSNDLGEFFP